MPPPSISLVLCYAWQSPLLCLYPAYPDKVPCYASNLHILTKSPAMPPPCISWQSPLLCLHPAYPFEVRCYASTLCILSKSAAMPPLCVSFWSPLLCLHPAYPDEISGVSRKRCVCGWSEGCEAVEDQPHAGGEPYQPSSFLSVGIKGIALVQWQPNILSLRCTLDNWIYLGALVNINAELTQEISIKTYKIKIPQHS